MIWIADPLMSTKEKKWRAFGVNCGFYRENEQGWKFFLVIFGHTLEGPSGRIYEPIYNNRAYQ